METSEANVRYEVARRLLERSVPGSQEWDDALAELDRTAEIAGVGATADALNDPSRARRYITAHVIAARLRAERRRDVKTANSFLLAVEPLYAKRGLRRQRLERLANTVAVTVARLRCLRGPLAKVRRQVWSACFGRSLYEAPIYAKDLRDQSVMVLGETGTGKELVAQTVAAANTWFEATLDEFPRTPRPAIPPSVCFNGAALDPANAVGELFGWRKGAFTGATTDRIGLISEGHGGTIFIDELGVMRRDLLNALLRTVEDRTVKPIGANQPQPVCARWITATSVDLDELVAAEQFSEDVRQRLAGLVIELPALRDWHVDDVRTFARDQLSDPSALSQFVGPRLTCAECGTSLSHRSPTGPQQRCPSCLEPTDNVATDAPGTVRYSMALLAQFDEELGRWLEVPRTWPGNTRQLIKLVKVWRVQREGARQMLDKIPRRGEGVPASVAAVSPVRHVDDRALAELAGRVASGDATLEDAMIWYVAHSRRADENQRSHAARLDIDRGTLARYARLLARAQR